MKLREFNIFSFALMMFPFVMVKFPWIIKGKSLYAIIQGVLLFLAVFSLFLLKEVKIIKRQIPLVMSLFLFFILMLFSGLKSGSISSINSIAQYFKFLMYSLIMGIYLSNVNNFKLESTLYCFSISICLLSLTCLTDLMKITEFYQYSYDFDVRTMGLLGSPNKSGILLAFAIGFNINSIIRNWNLWRFKFKFMSLLFLTTVAICALIVSASRSGLILTLIFTSVLFLVYFRFRMLKVVTILTVVLCFSSLVVISISNDRIVNYFKLRVLSSISFITHPTEREVMGASITNRVAAISDAIIFTLKNPVLGVGPGNIKEARVEKPTNYVPPFLNTNREIHLDISAHNSFLNTFAECGVIAGLIFIIIISLMLKSFYLKWKLTRDFSYGTLFSFYLTYIVFLFSQSVLWRNNLLFDLFVPLAISCIYPRFLVKEKN